MTKSQKTKYGKKALAEIKRRRDIRELEFKLYGQKRLKKFLEL
jgi:hypothetical protein